ncbi:MAG: helix-turn-helix transcriptional regulator [Ruminococcus sp.]|nr:helix-turn-helix transcriptional regulator [Ruminococcus sp.]
MDRITYQNKIKHLFPGCAILICENSSSSVSFDAGTKGILYICACSSGNTEYKAGGEYCYIAAGDMLFTKRIPQKCYMSDDFKGFTLIINTSELMSRLPFGINSWDIDLKNIISALEQNNILIVKSLDKLNSLSSELSNAENERNVICRLRVIELLINISNFDIERSSVPGRYFSKAQFELAKSIEALISSDPCKHMTIEKLAEIFEVSPTRLKTCFKTFYNDSIYSYTRKKRMQKAAGLLNGSSLSILEIAGECGYDNGSKFSKAFRSVYGLSPREYRMNK